MKGIKKGMIKESSRKIGEKGEDIAVEYLEKKGWKILERNFYIRGGEIDIIALDGSELVFIEVKFRTTDEFGEGAEQFTATKRKRVKKTGLNFLQNHVADIRFSKIRFDFITVTQAADSHLQIKHFKNVVITGGA